MQYLDAISKTTKWSWFASQGKPFYMTVIQTYTPHTDAREAEVDGYYEDLQTF